MRSIKYIVVHCTAGKGNQATKVILDFWGKLGWKSRGYHWLISDDGTAEHLTDDEQVSNGVKGHNANSINICYKGGWNGKDTRTQKQKETLKKIIGEYKTKYPNATVLGHRDLSPDLDGDGIVEPNEWVKLCPCFNAKSEYN